MPSEEGKAAVHLFVSGKVQGVFFRKYTHQAGTELGLTGWVRNLDDGRVEVYAQGPADGVAALETWCRTKGSPKSRVTGVESVPVTNQDRIPDDQFHGFIVRR
jgi:acylphosphatase